MTNHFQLAAVLIVSHRTYGVERIIVFNDISLAGDSTECEQAATNKL